MMCNSRSIAPCKREGFPMRSGLLYIGTGGLMLALGGGGAAGDDAAAVKELTSTGKLRVAVAVSPAPSALYSIKDPPGKLKGVTIELGRALAAKLQVDPQFLEFLASVEIQNSAANDVWDVSF